jgi:uncharacterized protein (DUF1778 family)
MMLPQVRTCHIGLRVTPELRGIIEQVADANGASMSDVILRYVIDRLVAEGYIAKEKPNERRNAGHAPVGEGHQV